VARRASSTATTARKVTLAPYVKPPASPDARAPLGADWPPELPVTPEPECSHSWLRGRDAGNVQHYRCAWCSMVVPR